MNIAGYFLVFLEGLLAFVSPCILPMLPVYLLYLSGKSSETPKSGEPVNASDDKGQTPAARKTSADKVPIINTLFFSLGFTLVFVLLGATSTALGQLLQGHRDLLERISGVSIIVLGIHMTGLIRIPFLNGEHRLPFPERLGGRISAFLLGIAFSLGWSPCLGPFLGSALLLSSQAATLLQGTLLLPIFSLGLTIPFLLTSLLFRELTGVFSWFKRHMKAVKIVSGLLLVAMGLLMLIGWFGYYARIFTL
jgi:cytochrome c-type biogenesis protein